MSLKTNHISLGRAFLIWFYLFVSYIIIYYFHIKLGSLALSNIKFLFYIFSGIYLGKKVLFKLVEFHPIYNTLNNVFMVKVGFFLLWPVAYPFLFVKLFIIRIL